MRRELAFTAYNRIDYLKETIDSWNNVRGLREWKAHFYIEPSPVQVLVTNECNRLNTATITHVNTYRQGVLVNPWNALNDRFEDGCDFVVLAEDDVVVSSDALEYLIWASEHYQDDEQALVVNLFSQIGSSSERTITRDGKFSPLVWGVWKDRWETHLRDSWDKNYSSGNPDGSEAGWDWNINRILAKEQLDVIKPLQSRSDHIGKYAGTHMTPDLFDSSRGEDFKLARGRQIYVEVQSGSLASGKISGSPAF